VCANIGRMRRIKFLSLKQNGRLDVENYNTNKDSSFLRNFVAILGGSLQEVISVFIEIMPQILIKTSIKTLEKMYKFIEQ
jgi:hypothetical protein